MSTNDSAINLSQLCQKWADEVAARHNTKVKYIDLFAQRDGADQRYKLSTKIAAIDYGTAVSRKLDNSFAFQSYASNDSPNPSTAVLSKSWQTQSNFTWNLKETIKVTAKEKLKGKIGLPLLAEGESETEINVEFDIESQQQWSATTTETWTVQQTVTLAAKCETVYTWVINKQEVDCPFTIGVNLTGNIAVWFEDKIDLNDPHGHDLHWLWYPSIQRVASELRDPKFTPVANGASLMADGVFTGIGATTNYVDIKTYPIGTIPPATPNGVSEGQDLDKTYGHHALSERRTTVSEHAVPLPKLLDPMKFPNVDVAIDSPVPSGV